MKATKIVYLLQLEDGSKIVLVSTMAKVNCSKTVDPFRTISYLVYGSCHIQSDLNFVKYRNWSQTLDVYLLFAILLGKIYLKITDL